MNTKQILRRRIKSPNPKFFRKVKKVGLIAGAVGTALLTAPIALTAVLTTVADYLVTAGVVASAVLTTAVERE